LRRDLARATGATASSSERAQRLVYLGAADLFRGRRDSAVAVFRRLVQLDPRYRPDRPVFPPDVTSVFANVRAETRAGVLVAPTGELAGIGQLPPDLRVVHVDTRRWPKPPADSLFLPERSGSRPALRALLGGVLLATTVAALPSVVGSDPPDRSRLAVAGAVGVAGALGYVLHRPGRPLTANIQANQAVRARWQQSVAAVKAQNAQRRDDV